MAEKYVLVEPKSGFSIDFSGMNFRAADLEGLKDKFARASAGIRAIEAGEIKNPDEKRKVTHFTDRASYCRSELYRQVEAFAAQVVSGGIAGGTGKPFEALVVNGIGGSALGPQLMQFAVNGPYWNELSRASRRGYLKIYFLDNTDSSGLADVLRVIDPETTLHLTVSKSGGTRETANNMTALEKFYAGKGLDFGRFAAAVTMPGSKLDAHARENNWLAVFAMAESIGGRTSETAVVGHVPAALTGVDFKSFIAGALTMDEWTRGADWRENPAMLLAAMWYIAGSGKGGRNMVIVPYSDRLVLLSRYLQQLVMESLGKELDLDGKTVNQGLSVFGNKGGTDAHAFIQQLNDGRDDFFATFIEPLRDQEAFALDGGLTMGYYLHVFLTGLTSALLAKGRQVISIRIPAFNAFALGQIIALYERTVAVYAEFININAFHQPGVQAYKLAANGVLEVRKRLFEELSKIAPVSGTASELAAKAGLDDADGVVSGWLDKASQNGGAQRFRVNGVWNYRINKPELKK